MVKKNCPLFKMECKKVRSICGRNRTGSGERLSVSSRTSSCLSVCLSVYLSVCLSVCQSVQLLSPSLDIREF